jgi:hypothetical protein
MMETDPYEPPNLVEWLIAMYRLRRAYRSLIYGRRKVLMQAVRPPARLGGVVE